MNDVQQSELRELRAEQRLLFARLTALEQRLQHFEAAEPGAAASPAVPAIAPVALARAAEPAPDPADAPPPAAPAATSAKAAAGSLEMQIGTTWLVRVGVVVLLTSVAFLGSYLYTHIVPHLGSAAKVALLYLAAGAVAGGGAWLERSRHAAGSDSLRRYARVVFAGGLAAVYYVTYAAHRFPGLRVVESPLLAGTLLLAWAAFMVFLAERRGSETLATVAILLAYYTSAINEDVAAFTLLSNLFLSAGAVFLLRRHLWRVFPFASVLATFGSYAFWNGFHSVLGWRGLDVPPIHDGTRFWTEGAFLLTYWLLFTWAAFSASDPALPPARRAGFASLNNGAFFLLATWLVLGERPEDFWRWSLGFGGVLISLAEAGRRRPRRLDPATEGAYALQGVLLVTLGFVTYFSGWQLSLVLAAQSVALLAAAAQRRSRLLLGASYAAGLLSFAWAANRLGEPGTAGPWTAGVAVGGFLVLAAWGAERLRLAEKRGGPAEPGGGSFRAWLAPGSVYFALLGLVIWLWLGEQQFPREVLFAVFSGAGGGVFALGVWRQERRWLWLSLLPSAVGLAAFWLATLLGDAHRAVDVLGVLILGGQQAWGRRQVRNPADFPRVLQSTDILAATLCAWELVTSWLGPWGGGAFTLTAGWSIFAAVVFGVGLALRERLYRWLGLVVLGATLLRVALVDIWRLDSLERVISGFVLAATLLGLGYLYNRYHERWRGLL